ncbi:hypothetical protein [Paraburkholderia sp. SG-MS1]|uniref:hypothetical protein n=1 Tax=Paraburkholderia sp. SG-MS1 TaxID=2023741 RepID=UPI0014450858|nr:hypothetical protein [Paraburkholderia sp. SG-MS1]
MRRPPDARPPQLAAVPEAILWVEHDGERWMYVLAHIPPQQICYAKYLNCKRSGMVDRVPTLLAHTQTNATCCPTLSSSEEGINETV